MTQSKDETEPAAKLSMFRAPRENLGLQRSGMAEHALLDSGSVIDEPPNQKTHSAEAVAVTNDVAVYVISKELYDKTVQTKELPRRLSQKQQSDAVRTETRAGRLENLIGAQRKMLRDGVEAQNGVNLVDFGKMGAKMHQEQCKRIQQVKTSQRLLDSTARKLKEINSDSMQPSEMSDGSARWCSMSVPSTARPSTTVSRMHRIRFVAHCSAGMILTAQI